MITYTRCYSSHAANFVPQPAQEEEWENLKQTGLFIPELSDIAISAWVGNDIAVMAGIGRTGENQAMAWALFGNCATRYFVPIHRRVKWIVAKYPLGRVEMLVEPGFKAGVRFVELLGMIRDLDTPTKVGWHDREVMVYKRINDDRDRNSVDYLRGGRRGERGDGHTSGGTATAGDESSRAVSSVCR